MANAWQRRKSLVDGVKETEDVQRGVMHYGRP